MLWYFPFCLEVKAETGNGGSAVMLCCRCILLLVPLVLNGRREIIRRQVVKTIYPAGYPNPEEVSGSGYFGF
ncbi:ASB2 [Symbiodinium sp. KB8]|nr:ASB2 [Symbiodinium sp. KB8]